MSHTVEIINTEISVVVVTETQVDAEDRLMMDLFLRLKEWGTRAALAEITLTQDGADPNLYSLEVRKKDARQVLITYLFASDQDNDPLMEIDLSPGWLASEMALGAMMRAAMIAMRAHHGLFSMEVEYP